MEKYSTEAKVWFNILDAAKNIPGAKIDRETFLQKEYAKYCDQATVDKILLNGSAIAGIELTLMDKIAADVIKLHANTATALSFAAGIPGGFAMLATVPADIAQFYFHVIAAAQKIAYTYGWNSMNGESERFSLILTVFIGVMAGIADANKTAESMFTEQFTNKLGKITLGKLLDKTAARVAVIMGLQFTKRNVFKIAVKLLPLIGGILSGGITLLSFWPMCNNLKNSCHDIVNDIRTKNFIGQI